MVGVPAATPVTRPVDELTVAWEVLLLAQVPPVVASDKEIPLPTQTTVLPEMPAGGPTVTDLVAATQPGVVNMMLVVPVPTPVTTPLETVAMVGLLLVHAPTVPVSERVRLVPVQRPLKPEMAEGTPLTVSTTVA